MIIIIIIVIIIVMIIIIIIIIIINNKNVPYAFLGANQALRTVISLCYWRAR